MPHKTSPIHLIVTIMYGVLAVVTVIPRAAASKECLLGYKALCTFSPIDTLILLTLAGLHIFLHQNAAAKNVEP
jgi:hypothetical protein